MLPQFHRFPIEILHDICRYLNAFDISLLDCALGPFGVFKLRNGAVNHLRLQYDTSGGDEVQTPLLKRIVAQGDVWLPKMFVSYPKLVSVVLSTAEMPKGRDLTPPIAMLTAWGQTLRELRLNTPRLLFLLLSPDYLALSPPSSVLSPYQNIMRLFSAISQSYKASRAESSTVSAGSSSNPIAEHGASDVPNPWLPLGDILPILQLLSLHLIPNPRGTRIQVRNQNALGVHFHRSLPPSLTEYSSNLFNFRHPELAASLPRALLRLEYKNTTIFPLFEDPVPPSAPPASQPLDLPPLLHTMSSNFSQFATTDVVHMRHLTYLDADFHPLHFPPSLLHLISPFKLPITLQSFPNFPPRLLTFHHTGYSSHRITNDAFQIFPHTLTSLRLPTLSLPSSNSTVFADLPPNLTSLSIGFLLVPSATPDGLKIPPRQDLHVLTLDDISALPDTLTHISISERRIDADIKRLTAEVQDLNDTRIETANVSLSAFPSHAVLSSLSVNMSISIDSSTWRSCPSLTHLNVSEATATEEAIRTWPSTRLPHLRTPPLRALHK